ncbi:glycosyltransferase [Brucella haematophila]|uniref:glycosyltransferase n=1 Tax=Brucella haematophila TaxID=419474 RepID=UPI00110ED306|nr:glycosyltransferase [Brucella haematophila]TMV01165.1 glycosyltransferase [Brucella haematophila]
MNNGSSGFDLEICGAISARLQRRGIARCLLVGAYGEAVRNGTTFCAELVQQSGVGEIAVFEAIADLLGLDFTRELLPSRVFISDEDALHSVKDIAQVMTIGPDGTTYLYIAPTEHRIRSLLEHVRAHPTLRNRIRICTPTLLRQILRRRYRARLIDRARQMTPQSLSASRVLHSWQAFGIAMALYLLVAAIINWPLQTFLTLHVLMTLFFFGCVLIRLFAVTTGGRLRLVDVLPLRKRDLPVYSVLVPLYREKEVIGQLVEVLSGINWPPSKLEIKLVCEEDDFETRDAIDRQHLPANFEVIPVPPGGPRTKPNALNYALQFVRGEIVAVFDAEDRPHPDQLREAWQSFTRDSGKLACVQAPLIIGNFRHNLLTRMFAFEYSALFRGLLPWLAGQGLVIPLGGTSNHFRRSCLEEVGGWDAFNVTEDADLGIRLARYGYSIGTISRGTIEDAPEDYDVWRKQRTRWIKGWIQTWLVHARDPYTALRQLGGWRFAINQIYTLGIISSALLHPIMLVTLAVLMVKVVMQPLTPSSLGLLMLDVVNILLAYLSFYLLGAKTMEPTERGGYAYLPGIPIYWMLISLSAWRALWQLVHKPYLWEKTPHRPSIFYLGADDCVMNAEPRPIMD